MFPGPVPSNATSVPATCAVPVLVAAALWAVGCSENGAPEAVGEIDDLEIRVDTTVEIALAGYFSDPDGDELAYSTNSSDTDVATVARSGDTAAVTGVAVGSAEITVTASDGSLSATQTFVVTVRRPTNREVLEILYDETDGDNWAYKTNWLTDGPLDEWYGVGADADSRVERLNLNFNGLSGPIPPELGDLSNLQHLDVWANNLTGPIPPELGGLSNLGNLYLNRNNLSGPIPPELGDLGDLQDLYLQRNNLSGPIPPELGGLSSLEILRVHNNADLEGELPSSFSKLTSLEVFLAYGTGVCVPETLMDWYGDISKRRATICADRPADAYMVQAVQSRSHPVPVVAEMTVNDHDPVEINTNRARDVLQRTGAIRAAEGGSGYWMGLMATFRSARGVAELPGTSSASVPDVWVMAHELGHNLSLWHAPCGNPANVDPDYPYEDGSIGAWGYDHRGDSLIDKDEAKDLMTYCQPEWVSDYHFSNAFAHRTVQEMSFGEARSRTGPSLLVWGARSPSGELSMDPALLVEGRSLLPEARGDYTLTGLDDAQRELFSISFEMDEPADAEEGTGIFVFLLPVEPGWEALTTLVLAGPGDALVILDGDTEATMALIRDVRSGQVRAIRGDFAERPPAPPGHVVRWSRGVPDGDAWSVMTGGGTSPGR